MMVEWNHCSNPSLLGTATMAEWNHRANPLLLGDDHGKEAKHNNG
jgi:hypothetical protein